MVEVLSHILPAARDRGEVFKVFDTFLAAASFVPIFLYVVFIFLFTRAELVEVLPRRLQMVSKILLLIFIPAIIAFNELASFVGVSQRTVIMQGQPVLAIGFSKAENQMLWTFFTSFTLALLTSYQAINFSLAFYRLVRALIDQHRIETTLSDEAHHLGGIAWITGALKLGAIETVIGFAGGSFGGAMTRRIIRLLARACLCIGLVKGPDSTEDFRQLEEELSAGKNGYRRSRLRDFISHPRHSTFRQLSPTATAFHEKPRAPVGPSKPAVTEPRAEGGLPGMKQFADLKRSATTGTVPERRERVTIHFENGAPSLHVRFSALDIPPIAFDAKRRSRSEWLGVSRHASIRPASQAVGSPRNSIRVDSPRHSIHAVDVSRRHSIHAASPHNSIHAASTHNSLLSELVINESGPDIISISDLQSLPEAYIPTTRQKARAASTYSTRSVPESVTSLSVVREIASQFPPLPAHALETIKQSPDNDAGEFWDDTNSIISPKYIVQPTSPATMRSPASNIDPFLVPDDQVFMPTFVQPTRMLRDANAEFKVPSVPSSALSTPMTILSNYAPTQPSHSAWTGDTEGTFLDFGSALDTGKSRGFVRDSDGVPQPVTWIDYDAIPKSGHTSAGLTSILEVTPGQPRTPSRRRVSRRKSSLGITAMTPRRTDSEGEKQLSKMVQESRIKNIGQVTIHETPAPMRGHKLQRSLHIERILIPPKECTNVEIIQGSLDSSHMPSVLRDSEVLEIEDESRYF
ncbi:hypothetical protein H0H81_007816 [Sphagnurus paluster]|uniref:Uncharacterized protein n=1 Tax=Sphagnurus paluster TaxID=117069 RepID=A0A9P7GQK7_9AGAR|nr:hypothetical protein H0H81_007816 [Sphagnurus paluster]